MEAKKDYFPVVVGKLGRESSILGIVLVLPALFLKTYETPQKCHMFPDHLLIYGRDTTTTSPEVGL